MILFNVPTYDHMADTLLNNCSVTRGNFSINRFANQELYITVRGPLRGEHCLALGSIAPPDEQLLSFTLLAHTLKKEGARKVTALLPYLAYSRHDKDKPGESMAMEWVGLLLKSSGIDEVITFDLHSEWDKELFPIPITSISTAQLFAEAIRKHSLTDATLVAPDNGALRRCCEVKDAANLTSDIICFEKQRTLQGITHTVSAGDLGPRVVIIDDILDTGGTLVSACKQLNEKGVREIYIMVTHGQFTGTHWRKLWALKVKTISCTDTIALRKELNSEPIETLSVIPLMQRQLEEVYGDARAVF